MKRKDISRTTKQSVFYYQTLLTFTLSVSKYDVHRHHGSVENGKCYYQWRAH